ncbi:MAG: FimB/Mfa2 family fimbrial subunit, partial [Dysgonamonadaceae bacterium]|nr:FimB/Mfa2 family fimbrial subunit [Dysgonamonadaceae bacterium]
MKNFRNKIFITLFALGTIFWGCDSLLFEDLADCAQGVYVKFYSKTPCASDSTFIGSVPSLTVFAFDENDKLVTSISKQNVTLDHNFKLLIPVSNGNFTFIAWAGMNSNFVVSRFTNGTTTKKDVMLKLNTSSNIAPNLNDTHIWQGESSV